MTCASDRLRMMADQPGDGVRLSGAWPRRVAGPLVRGAGSGIEAFASLKPRPSEPASGDLVLRQLAVDGGIEADDADRHLAAADALHLQGMQAAELAI